MTLLELRLSVAVATHEDAEDFSHIAFMEQRASYLTPSSLLLVVVLFARNVCMSVSSCGICMCVVLVCLR